MSIFKKKVVIIGCGGLALDLVETIEKKRKIAFFIEQKKDLDCFLGYDVRKDLPRNPSKYDYVIAIADNKARAHWFIRLDGHGLKVLTIISDGAKISKTASIDDGCYIGKNAVINANARIGYNTIIRDCVFVAHEAQVGSHSYISPCCSLTGCSEIGFSSFVGANATVLPCVKVGEKSIIGANAVVTKDLAGNGVYAGVPARYIKEIK